MGNQWQADRDLLTSNDDGQRRSAPGLIVVHTSEGDNSADALAKWQQMKSAGGSYHLVVDKTGRAVRENDDAFIPWAAGQTANRQGLHVCAIGYARWTRSEWLARPAQLARVREIIDFWAARHGIPLKRINGHQIRAGARGVCGHADVSTAWGETDHWDPGAGFPYDVVVRPARAHVVSAGETLAAIARKYGTSVPRLAELNGIQNPDRIMVGQSVALP